LFQSANGPCHDRRPRFATWAPLRFGFYKEGEANMISAAFPYQKKRQRILGSEMAYVEVGEGHPIVLLHGNPTSSYLWRNVLLHLEPLGRCIAPDLIGMGDSDKLPDSGPDSYHFVEHCRYLDALLEALDVHERVTSVCVRSQLAVQRRSIQTYLQHSQIHRSSP